MCRSKTHVSLASTVCRPAFRCPPLRSCHSDDSTLQLCIPFVARKTARRGRGSRRATRASQQMCTLPSPRVGGSCHHEIKILLAPRNSVSNLHGRCLCNRVCPPGTNADVQHHAHRPVDDSVRCACPHAGSRLPDGSITEGRCDIHEFRSHGHRKSPIEARWPVSLSTRSVGCAEGLGFQPARFIRQSFV